MKETSDFYFCFYNNNIWLNQILFCWQTNKTYIEMDYIISFLLLCRFVLLTSQAIKVVVREREKNRPKSAICSGRNEKYVEQTCLVVNVRALQMMFWCGMFRLWNIWLKKTGCYLLNSMSLVTRLSVARTSS